jgi:regulation of enolase protein 1 (concanavalin A-like superfamily)
MLELAPKVPSAGPVHKQIQEFPRVLAVVLLSLFTPAVLEHPQAAVSGAWSPTDVGSPALRGSAQESTCTTSTGCPVFSLTGGGVGVGGTSDQFMFLSQRLTGDGVITVRLLSLAGSITAEAGLMVRESLAGNARHASLLVSTGGVAFRSRVATGGNTASLSVPRGSWLRLERTGPAVTASISSDGAQWTVAATQTLTLPSTVYVGLVVTGRSSTALATATMSSMAVASTAPTLPSGWTSADVGAAAAAGTASYSNGSFIATSSGLGFANASDGFRFLYRRVKGDTKLQTRVVASEGKSGRQAGIAFRASLDGGAVEVALVADEAGVLLVRRSGAAQTASKTRVASTVAPVYLQLDRRGSMVTVLYSIDGVTWKPVTALSVAFPAEIYAGLAVAAGPNGGTAAAAFDRLSLVSVSANAPPVVSLTSPANAQIFVQGQAVTMTANASDPDDLVSRVEFRVNGVTVATDTAAPYSAPWTAGTPGVYTLVARATDFDGAVTSSSSVTVMVVSSTSSGPGSTSGSTSGSTGSTGSSSGGSSTPTSGWRLTFDASQDHAIIQYYSLEIYVVGTRLLVLSKNIGKPALTSKGGCIVDVNSWITALPAGLFEGVVRAVSPSGQRSGGASTTFTK